MTALINRTHMTRASLLLVAILSITLLAWGCGDQQSAIAERGKEQADKTAETGNGGGDRVARAPSSLTLPSGTVMVGTLQTPINTGKNDE
ncbi:MAG TPA: hypothetical protein VFV24_05485, partial [Candidatus Eisenbacteria bacterium]|nr:hypothetical protein [Candidatus Eisenbacteria bacterium]